VVAVQAAQVDRCTIDPRAALNILREAAEHGLQQSRL
jgi:hypothetical protein